MEICYFCKVLKWKMENGKWKFAIKRVKSQINLSSFEREQIRRSQICRFCKVLNVHSATRSFLAYILYYNPYSSWKRISDYHHALFGELRTTTDESTKRDVDEARGYGHARDVSCCQNRVGGKRSSFLPTFVFRPLTPPYMRFRIRRFLTRMQLHVIIH